MFCGKNININRKINNNKKNYDNIDRLYPKIN